MQPPDFDVVVTSEEGGVVVAVSGELDLYTGPVLWERLSGALAEGERRVVLDVRDMRFMDSTGVSIMAMALGRLRERGGELVVRAPRRMVSKLLDVTGLSRVVTVENAVSVPA